MARLDFQELHVKKNQKKTRATLASSREHNKPNDEENPTE